MLVLLGLATAMTETTPARHDNPVWPWPVRISLDNLPEVPALQRLVQLPIEFALVGSGLTILAIVFLVRRRPILLSGTLFVVVAGGAAIGLQPLMIEAYPTSFTRPPLSYTAGSIAEGMAVYQAHCASCHGTPAADREVPRGSTLDLLGPRTARRSAGDLFWLITTWTAGPRDAGVREPAWRGAALARDQFPPRARHDHRPAPGRSSGRT